MKKILSSILILLTSSLLFAQAAKITNTQYEVIGAGGLNIGKTNVKILEMKYPVDTKTVFKTQQEFENYIEDYKNKLLSTREFQDVKMEYKYSFNDNTKIYDVEVFFTLEDSNHLLALPYPKYSTGGGFDFKLKAKDTNFLGTLNPLSTDLFYNWVPEYDKDGKVKSAKNSAGINFSYNYPFKAGIFNSVWENSLNYTHKFEDKEDNLSASTGVTFTLPFELLSLNFGFYQGIGLSSVANKIDSNTKLNFKETLYTSTPINIYKFSNYTTLTYNPYFYFHYSWGFQDWELVIQDKQNISLTFGHSLSNSNISFNDHFRKGYSFSLNNSVDYNFATGNVNPSLSFEAKYFNNFPILEDKNFLQRFGIASRTYGFMAIAFPNSNDNTCDIGNFVRGLIGGKKNVTNALIINFDMPLSLFTTTLPWNILNFNLQMSPFVDIALTYDSESGNLLNWRAGTYCAGLEFLVNPIRFSSYTIRASIGFNALPILQADSKLKAIKPNSELYFGLDYHF